MTYGTGYEPVFVIYLQLLEPKILVCVSEILLLNIIAEQPMSFYRHPYHIGNSFSTLIRSYYGSASLQNWQRTDRRYSLVQYS